MKNKYSFVLLIAISLFAFSWNSLNKRDALITEAYQNSHLKFTSGSPVAKTGAPGEGNCTSCHSGTVQDGNTVNVLVMTDQNNAVVTQYTPGETYTVTINSEVVQKRGFQLSMRIVSNNTQAGSATASSNTSIATQGTKQFVNHKSSSTGSATGWSFTWTAPATDVGDVRFYVAINKTNNNNNDSGDQILLSQHTFSPTPPVVPTASFTESASEICQGHTVAFTNASSGAPTTYLWAFPGGTPSSSSNPNETVTYNAPGTYTATLIVSNTAGADTTSTEISVITCASVSETAKKDLIVYLNQESSVLTVKNIDLQSQTEIHVLDLNGKVIARKKVSVSDENLDLSHLRAGSYLVKVLGKKAVSTKKIVKF